MNLSLPSSSFRKQCVAAISLMATASLASAAVFTGWTEDYTGQEANTLLLWKFDSGSTGSERADSSGNGWVVSSNATITKGTFGTAGKFGQSYFANPTVGSDVTAMSAVTGITNVFNGSAMSVEMWFAPNADTFTGGYLFDKQYNSNDGIVLHLNADGSLKLGLGNGTATKTLTSTAQSWEANTWQHVAVTYSNVDDVGTAKIFLNGVEVASDTYAGFGNLTAGSRRWNIANRSASTYFPMYGYYDNFRVSNVAYEYGAPIPEGQTVGLLLGSAPLILWGIRRMRASR